MTSTSSSGAVDASTSGVGGAGPPPTDAQGVVSTLCPEIAAESIVCIGFINGHELSAFGLDTGTACTLRTLDTAPYEVSIAAVGTDILYCDPDGVVRAPMMGGAVESLSVDCGGIFNFGAGVALAPYSQGPVVTFYDSFDDIVTANDTGTAHLSINAASFASFGDTIWATEQIATAFYEYIPPDENPVRTVSLGDNDGAVQGLAVVDDDTIVFGHPFAIYIIDRMSGQILSEVDVGDLSTPTGLSCYRPL